MFGRFLGLAASIAVVSIGVAGVASRAPGIASDPSPASEPTGDSWTAWNERSDAASSVPDGPSGEVRLNRSGDSHFYANANVDGASLRMMVDSGASIVALTRRDAEAIGINVDNLSEGGFAETAGGRVPVRPVMLASIDIDGVEVRNVQAAVLDMDMPHSLLGQSYLSQLDAVNIEGDTMTLR